MLLLQAGYTQNFIDALLRTVSFWSDERLAAYIEQNLNYDVPGYKMGTPRVPNDGLAYLHEDEAVINAPLAAMMRRALGMKAAPASSYGSNNSRRLTIENMVINAGNGQNGRQLRREVELALENVLRSVM